MSSLVISTWLVGPVLYIYSKSSNEVLPRRALMKFPAFTKL